MPNRVSSSSSSLFHINPYDYSHEFTFPTIAFCSTLRIGPYLFYIENLLLNSKRQKKMIGHRSRFRENDDLPLRRGPAVKKKPLITSKIMRSRDARRNTGE